VLSRAAAFTTSQAQAPSLEHWPRGSASGQFLNFGGGLNDFVRAALLLSDALLSQRISSRAMQIAGWLPMTPTSERGPNAPHHTGAMGLEFIAFERSDAPLCHAGKPRARIRAFPDALAMRCPFAQRE
jgi:hypothetical protein